MKEEDKLDILKADLQRTTNANDKLLKMLLEQAENAIKKEGIQLKDDAESGMLQVQYAAYLFRKRAAQETGMPRYLRWEMNNMLFSQKGKKDDV